jgi:hypothetical protein
MTYVRCINNKAYIRFKDESPSDEALIDLTVGNVYKVLPDVEAERSGSIRVIDNSGEDYWYPAEYFEPINWNRLSSDFSDSLTIHIDGLTKAILRAEALAAGMSMSSLVHEWINKHLDLPSDSRSKQKRPNIQSVCLTSRCS